MRAAGTIPVSVVIAARDEAATIVGCIESVRWASEVIVVENDSADCTADIAREAGAVVLEHQFVTIGGQRNAAIEKASHEWVLVVDADERATPELGREIERVIAEAQHDAWRIKRRNFFLGREVRHGGWERDRPIRLFRSVLRYDASRVHEHVVVTGSAGALSEALVHEPYATLGKYFDKLDRYSRWWAEDRLEKGRRVGAGNVVIRPPLRFLSMYLLRGGWMDGAPGAVLACMAATSVMAKYARLWAAGRESGP